MCDTDGYMQFVGYEALPCVTYHQDAYATLKCLYSNASTFSSSPASDTHIQNFHTMAHTTIIPLTNLSPVQDPPPKPLFPDDGMHHWCRAIPSLPAACRAGPRRPYSAASTSSI
ncbi:hypothetical protein BU23DRAFT_12853 [Bimuria novae-zelandiae CBS 107.79]|uniref:Uncharacterized protein n=1 Tax=Bimuria novae-zelandiae CBS 107.79 TaxID=1447943 RepID=A0A6A5VGY1_9PLEO|nr:hypothetical protein BU23DRAFT_12853 [Bimuria novae-zelandiae CBS 107.79]